MTIDYRAFNKATGLLTAPGPSTVHTNMLFCGWECQLQKVWSTKGMQEQAKPQFAFTWGGRQYIFYHLPQAFKHGPTFAHATLAKQLASIILPHELTILHYTDDTRIGGHDEQMLH